MILKDFCFSPTQAFSLHEDKAGNIFKRSQAIAPHGHFKYLNIYAHLDDRPESIGLLQAGKGHFSGNRTQLGHKRRKGLTIVG
jgi:hypothetical protein